MIRFVSVICFIAFVFLSNSSSQNLLYSQTGLAPDQRSLPSYQNLSTSWEQVADDFTVASDWSINKIVVIGDDIDTNNVDGFNVFIYSDNRGTPGTLISSAQTQPFSILFLQYFIWKVTITLEEPITLNAGHYWISVQYHGTNSSSIGWYWTQVTTGFNKTAVFRNYMRYCSAWAPIWHCLYTPYTDMYFELYGSYVVPVELTSFTANSYGGNVELKWITATETNNKGFEIQSKYGNEFKALAFIPGHGTTAEAHSYSFTDKDVTTGRHSYMLKQIDYNATAYSNILEVDVKAPSKFLLDQNYPNPFNPNTKINFSLAADSRVTLKVFDLLGQEVATLVKGERSEGDYSVEFKATGMNSGMYFYRLEAEGEDGSNFREVKKMILTK